MVTDEMIAGNGEPGMMVHGPAPKLQPLSLSGTLNLIVALERVFAALIASRRVQPPGSAVHTPSPGSAVLLTISVGSSLAIVPVAVSLGFVAGGISPPPGNLPDHGFFRPAGCFGACVLFSASLGDTARAEA